MPQLNYECEALAEVLDIGVSEEERTDQATGQKTQQIVVATEYRLHYLADLKTGMYKDDDGNWLEPVADQDVRIKSYHYLLKKDGSLNDMSFEQLRDAFRGWNPSDLFALQDDPSLRRELVKIRCQNETYNNKVSIRVKWLGNQDSSGPGLRKTDANAQKSVLAKFGSKLRATFGAQKPTPKPAGAPTAPKVPPATPPASLAPKHRATKPVAPPPELPTDAIADVNSAFAWFSKYFEQHGETNVRSEWARLTQAAVDAGQDYESIDWKVFCEQARTEFLPF